MSPKKSKKKVDFQLINLKTLDGTGERFFRVFKESDMPDFDFSKIKGKKGEEPVIEST